MIKLGLMSYWFPDHYDSEVVLKNRFYWMLSSLLLKKHFPKTKFVGTQKAVNVLIKKLGLSFDEVEILSEDFMLNKNYHIWSAGKILVYSKQTEPFIHIDYDTFLWEALPEKILNASLVAMHDEFHHKGDFENFIKKAYGGENFLPIKHYFPHEVSYHLENDIIQRPYNMSIFGGNDTNFIKDFALSSLKAMTSIDWEKNYRQTDLWNGTKASLLFEQYFFGAFVWFNRREVEIIRVRDGFETRWEHLSNSYRDLDNKRRIKEFLRRNYPEDYDKCLRFRL